MTGISRGIFKASTRSSLYIRYLFSACQNAFTEWWWNVTSLVLLLTVSNMMRGMKILKRDPVPDDKPRRPTLRLTLPIIIAKYEYGRLGLHCQLPNSHERAR